jgi:hypothetical protein
VGSRKLRRPKLDRRLELHFEIGVYRYMKRRPYRVILPAVIGCISGLLMIWDFYNSKVIESMGMAWDTGPPFWPYEASWIALLSINTPAYVISAPLFLFFSARTSAERYPLFLSVILIWWWWLGRRLDSGLLPSRRNRHRWVLGVALILAASTLYCIGITFILDYARFFSEYGHVRMRLLRTGGPMLWCFALAIAATISAFRVVHFGRPPTE